MSGISSRFQQQAVQSLCSVPPDVKCPCCLHRFDIVVSRQQLLSGWLSRKLFRFFRCRVCGTRFRTLNPELVRWPIRVAVPVMALVVLAILSIRHQFLS